MRGYIIGKDGKPVQFRVHDPSTGQTSMGLLVVRGGAVSMVDVLPGQFSGQNAQVEPTPGNRVGAMPGEMGAGGGENGLVVADQHEPTGRTAPLTAEQEAAAAANAGNGNGQADDSTAAGDRDPVLQGAAADL